MDIADAPMRRSRAVTHDRVAAVLVKEAQVERKGLFQKLSSHRLHMRLVCESQPKPREHVVYDRTGFVKVGLRALELRLGLRLVGPCLCLLFARVRGRR